MNNSSSRVLALVAVLVFGGGTVLFFGYQFIWSPYKEARDKLELAQKLVADREQDFQIMGAEKVALAKWNKLSLPKDPNVAAAEYSKMLKPLLRDCGLAVEDFQGPPPQEGPSIGSQKKARHIALPFVIRAKGTVESLAKTLEALQRMPVMHRVKTLVVDRLDAKDKGGRVGVQMTIETVIVYGADNQPKLDGLKGLSPPSSTRNYLDVAMRNPFLGLVPVVVDKKPVEVVEKTPLGPDLKEFIYIDTIIPSSNEAVLRNRLYNKTLRVKSTRMSGYDIFSIRDDDYKQVLKGRILRIDQREIFFQEREVVYRLHFGQTLADAMGRPLSDAQIESFELNEFYDPDFGADEATPKKAGTTKRGITTKPGTTK